MTKQNETAGSDSWSSPFIHQDEISVTQATVQRPLPPVIDDLEPQKAGSELEQMKVEFLRGLRAKQRLLWQRRYPENMRDKIDR